MPYVNKSGTTSSSVTSLFHLALHSLSSIMLSQMTGFPSFLNFLLHVGVQLVNNVVFVSDEQQSDSVLHIHISILSQIFFFSLRLLQKIEHSSLCCIYSRILVIHCKYSSMCMSRICLVRDTRGMALIPVLGRSPGEGNGHPFLNSCLGNSMDRGAWQATVHGGTKS